MRQMFIPTIGFQFYLGQDWTFTLHRESRNTDLFDALGVITESQKVWNERFEPRMGWDRDKMKISDDEYIAAANEWREIRDKLDNTVQVTLPVETLLKVDRIYIRKGASDFDSITFWATLKDVNNIVFMDNPDQDRAALILSGWCRKS